MSERKTSRTDALIQRGPLAGPRDWIAFWDMAVDAHRQLESDLIAAHTKIVEIDDENEKLKAKLIDARAEVERLRKGADLSLVAMQDVLEAAYHRCYQSCCGRLGMECCGNPVQTWTKDDEHIMKTLGPVEKSLRAALAAKEPKTENMWDTIGAPHHA